MFCKYEQAFVMTATAVPRILLRQLACESQAGAPLPYRSHPNLIRYNPAGLLILFNFQGGASTILLGKKAHEPWLGKRRRLRPRLTRIRVLHRAMELTPAKFSRGKIDSSAEALRVCHRPYYLSLRK